MKLQEIKNKLTWRDAMGVDLNKIEGFGLLLKDKKGNIYEVGEYTLSVMGTKRDSYCYVDDAGCGCCASQLEYIKYAFLSEFIEEAL